MKFEVSTTTIGVFLFSLSVCVLTSHFDFYKLLPPSMRCRQMFPVDNFRLPDFVFGIDKLGPGIFIFIYFFAARVFEVK